MLTQLEAARASRGPASGEGKAAAAAGAKSPDGVVLYELHSRPEQEKFSEAAKVSLSDTPHQCVYIHTHTHYLHSHVSAKEDTNFTC